MEFRTNGKNALRSILNKEQNINTLEKIIYNSIIQEDFDEDKSKLRYNNITQEDFVEDKLKLRYNELIYETIGEISNGKKLKEISDNIKNSKIGWKNPVFKELEFRMEEQDNFIENPFEVEEGALTCNKCGSKRVFYYQVQSRSCDEPYTTKATCVACKSKWTYSG